MRGILCILLGLVLMGAPSIWGFTVTPRISIVVSDQGLSSLFKLRATVDDEEELVKVPRRRRQRGRLFESEEEERAFYDRVEERLYDDFDDEEDYDEEDWEDEDDDEEYGLFSNVLIDNPLLDSIDPDGAAERFPELAADPKFWIDILLFIAFLNFLSAVGPQDYFPDLPWYPDGIQIGTAGM